MSTAIQTSLEKFQAIPVKDAARELLATLGYNSDKFIVGAGSQRSSDRGHRGIGGLEQA